MNNHGQTRFVNRMRLVPDDTYDTTAKEKPDQYLGDIQQLRQLFQPSTQQAYKRAEKQYAQVMQQPDHPNRPPYLRQKEILDALQNFKHMQNIYKQQAQQAIATSPTTDKLLTRLITVMEKKVTPSFSSSKQKKPRFKTRLITVMEKKVTPSFSSSKQKKPRFKVMKRLAPFRSGPIPYKRQRIEQHPEQFDDRSAADDEFVLADEDREYQEDEQQEEEEEPEFEAAEQPIELQPVQKVSPVEKAKKRTPEQKENVRRATASTKRVADIPSGTATIKSRLRSTTQRAAGLWYRSVIENPIPWVNIRHIGD